MQRGIAVGLLALTLNFLPARSAPRDFAAGVTLGSPTGLTVMENFGPTEAVQAAMEYGIYGTFVLHTDYLFKDNRLFHYDEKYGKSWLYYGPGVRVEIGDRDISPFGPYRHSDNARVALRFPTGLQYYIPQAPFDVFIEVAPMLSLWHATNLDMTAALGVRFDL